MTGAIMIAADFRRVALSFEGVEEGSHVGAVDYSRYPGRVRRGGTRHVPAGCAWLGEDGATHIRLAKAKRDGLTVRCRLHASCASTRMLRRARVDARASVVVPGDDTAVVWTFGGNKTLDVREMAPRVRHQSIRSSTV